MKFGYVLCGVAVASLALGLTAAWPQDAKVKDKAAPGEAAAPIGEVPGQARRAKAMLTGEQHQQLATLAGKWATVDKLYMLPDKDPVESKGASDFKVIMDGRFLLENHESTGPMGTFTGLGIMGFNNLSGEFEQVRIDTMATGMFKSTGTWDADSSSFRWRGEFDDPMTGGKIKGRSVLRKVSDTEWKFQMFEDRAGVATKTIEVSYTKM